MFELRNKRILITGVCGAVGAELLRQVLTFEPREVIGLDNNESALFFMLERYKDNHAVRPLIGDVRDLKTLTHHMIDIDVVIHAAALKHVLLCEESPRDAVYSNILGVQNIIDASLPAGVKRVLFTSSDKAVNPTNVMGTSKLMGERLLTAANTMSRDSGPLFFSSRFGNVLGSSGSVIPLFRRQIAGGGPVTLTDPGMTRFIMTLSQAVKLTIESIFLACGGEVFITKMPVARIEDLAQIMIEMFAPRHGHDPDGIAIDVIGAKPGEKMYEELLNDEERRRTVEMENYFVVLPAFKTVYENIEYRYPGARKVGVDRVYNSSVERALTKDELREYLVTHRIFDNIE